MQSVCIDHGRQQFVNVGCRPLLEAVNRVKPKLHVFGHIHEGSGIYMHDQTLMVNASIMDKYYSPQNHPKVVFLK